jgi:hypothetical protein
MITSEDLNDLGFKKTSLVMIPFNGSKLNGFLIHNTLNIGLRILKSVFLSVEKRLLDDVYAFKTAAKVISCWPEINL